MIPALRSTGGAHHETAALHVSYGQRTEQRERRSLRTSATGWNSRPAAGAQRGLRAIGGSPYRSNIAVPEAPNIGASVPVTYVRSASAFFAIAVSWRKFRGERIYIGAVEPDSSGIRLPARILSSV